MEPSRPARSRPASRARSARPPRPQDCTITLPVEIDVSVKVRSKCKPFGASRTRGGMIADELLQSKEEIYTENEIAPGISMQQISVLQKAITRQRHIVSALAETNFPTRIKSLNENKNKMNNETHDHKMAVELKDNGDKQKQQHKETVVGNRNNFHPENYKQAKTIATGAIKKSNKEIKKGKNEKSHNEQYVEDDTFKSQLWPSVVSDIKLYKIDSNDDADQNESVDEKTKSENKMN